MATLTSEIKLVPAAEIETAERIDVGTHNGQPLTIEKEFSGEHIAWIGQEAFDWRKANTTNFAAWWCGSKAQRRSSDGSDHIPGNGPGG